MIKNSLLYKFPDFRNFFVARIISLVGDSFSAIAVSWWIVSRGTEHSKLEFGLMMATITLPRILFGPLFGVLVDRFSRKKCMLIADIARAGLAATMALLMTTGLLTLPILFVLCFLIALFAPLFEAAEGAALMQITAPEYIERTTALHSTAFNISNLFGLFVGASIIALLGTTVAFWLNALSFLLSFVFVWLVKNPLPAPERVERSPLQDFASGLRYMYGKRPLFWLTVFFMISNLIATPLMMIIPLQVKFMFNETVFWVAAFEGAISAGALIMGVVLARHAWKRDAYATEMSVMVGIGLICVVLGVSYNKLFSVGLYFLLGVGIALSQTVIGTLFQRAVDDEYKGRFFSLVGAIATAVMPLGFATSGFLAEVLSVPQILIIFGAAHALLAFGMLALPRVDTKE